MKRWSSHLLILLYYLLFFSGCDSTPTNQVTLEVGDNFQVANDMHPEGTVFLVRSGVHRGQQVRHPKQ